MSLKTQRPPRPRKPYRSPRLVQYGEVRTLTQAGTMGINEGAAMTNTMRRNASDRASKENIVRVGTHPLGIGLYLFDYKPGFRDRYGHARQFGVMADEVETVLPGAVSVHPRGYKMVDYAMLGVRRSAR